MEREFDLAFIKLHILYLAAKEEIYGMGMIEELGRHGYRLSPGTLYPALAKMESQGLLTSRTQTVNHKQRKYYRITKKGISFLEIIKTKISELYLEIIENK